MFICYLENYYWLSFCQYVDNPQNKLAGNHRSDVLENLTPQVRARVDALKDIQVFR